MLGRSLFRRFGSRTFSTDRQIVSIVPIRAGSRRIKHKNIRALDGLPLVFHTLKAFADHRQLARIPGVDTSRLLVVSEDSEYLDMCQSFMDRNHSQCHTEYVQALPALTGDDSCLAEVCAYAVLQVNDLNALNAVCLLRATSPCRTGQHIHECLSTYATHLPRHSPIAAGDDPRFDYSPVEIDSVVSVVEETGVHPSRVKEAWTCRQGHTLLRDKYAQQCDCTLVTEGPQAHSSSSQATGLLRNSAVYVTHWRSLFAPTESLWGERAVPYEMDRSSSVDVNDEFDWLCAEAVMKSRRQ